MELQHKHILVAVDGSDASDTAFEKAIELCKRHQHPNLPSLMLSISSHIAVLMHIRLTL
ncbi:universal stress protein [Salinibacillus xinjiangensis]|uniref:universal stress protein n=1 Tax=Salinibacillus xinjiangensis TaxID=1229268 RepID=UPI002B27A86F|nr:universal stress protein [Salinibacillus xinjiangensis]